ncbi:MAG: SMP-30/gluconolactonase/LRE family protein, partial [Tropicimonas sp.]
MLEIDPESGAVTGTREVLRLQDGIPDGACMDAEGNFWITVVGPGKVLRFSAAGRILETRSLPVT